MFILAYGQVLANHYTETRGQKYAPDTKRHVRCCSGWFGLVTLRLRQSMQRKTENTPRRRSLTNPNELIQSAVCALRVLLVVELWCRCRLCDTIPLRWGVSPETPHDATSPIRGLLKQPHKHSSNSSQYVSASSQRVIAFNFIHQHVRRCGEAQR